MHYKNTAGKNGYDYFITGLKLIKEREIMPYVILPMLVNIIVMSLLYSWVFIKASVLIKLGLDFIPNWLQWLSYLVYAIIIFIMIFFFCYIFSTATNIIAAPFNGLLSEKVESLLVEEHVSDFSIMMLLKDVPRILKRECYKLIYYFAWAVPLFFLYWIPVLGQTLAPIMWFIFTGWMVNIQYIDYSFDNHRVSFTRTRGMLRQHKWDNLLFGLLVSIFTLVPFFNLIIMPTAVCGSTAMWVDRYRSQIYRHK